MRARLMLLVYLLSGCGGDGMMMPPPPETRKWTVFIYGHADHNLSASLVRDLQEMVQAPLGADIHVVLMADWDASAQFSSTENFPSGSEWYYIRDVSGTTTASLMKTDPEQNLDDPDVLRAAIVEAFDTYKGERHALILWDHGGAWKAGFGGDSQNGTVQGSGVSLAELQGAIQSALTDLGIAKLDLLAFDTCLMGGVEELYAFRNLAQVYTANAEIDYGDGLDYAATLGYLATAGDGAATAIGTAEVAQWDNHHRTASPSDTLLRSHVSIDTSKIETFTNAMAELVVTLTTSPGIDGAGVARRVFGTLPAYSSDLEQNVSDATGSLRDVGQFLDQAAADPALTTRAQAARAALDDMTLGTSLGTLRTSAGQTAVHIELPLASELSPNYLSAYQAGSGGWGAAAQWGNALSWLFAERDTTGPQFTHEILTAAPFAVRIAPLDLDVAQADVNLAVFETQTSVLLYGLIGSAPIEPALQYDFPWSGGAYIVGQSSVFIVPWIPVGSSSLVLAAWGILHEPNGGEWEARLLFQDGDSQANVFVVYENGRGITATAQQLARDFEGMAFTPILPAIDLDTSQVSLRAGDDLLVPSTGGFPVAYGQLIPGTYVVMSTVKDVWGNTSDEIDVVDLP